MHIVVKAASTRRVSYRQFGSVHFEPKVVEVLEGQRFLEATRLGGKVPINYVMKGAPYECLKLGALVQGTKLDKSRLLYEARQVTGK
jgi:hypothetical protein